MDALWPNLAPQAAAANLRKAVHFARRTLGSESAIGTKAEMIALWPEEAVLVDATRFENAARAALAANDRAAATHAATLYEGELLPDDRYASWASEPRERAHPSCCTPVVPARCGASSNRSSVRSDSRELSWASSRTATRGTPAPRPNQWTRPLDPRRILRR
jgi:hypothetical protein